MKVSSCKVNTIYRIFKDYVDIDWPTSAMSLIFDICSLLSNPKFNIIFAVGNNFCNLQYDRINSRLEATL